MICPYRHPRSSPQLPSPPGSPGQAEGRWRLSAMKLVSPTAWEPRAPYLDGPQPRMLRLKGHDLGRVGNAEQHIEALVLLQDPPCGSPKDFSAPHPFLGEVSEALPRPQEPTPLQTPEEREAFGGLRPPPRCTAHPPSSPGVGYTPGLQTRVLMPSSGHHGARWPGPNHMDLDDPDKSLQNPSFPSEQHATNSCPDGRTRPL